MSARDADALDREALENVARAFARELRAGDVVALRGELGAGKTTFVAALVRALTGQDAASSPTFVFRQRYDGPPAVEHLDLYRLEDRAGAVELGLHEAFEGDAIVCVEWPERLPELIPASSFVVRIAGSGDGPRHVAIERPATHGRAR